MRVGGGPWRLVVALAITPVLAGWLSAGGFDPAEWRAGLQAFPYTNRPSDRPVLTVVRQDAERLQRNQSVVQTPLTLGQRKFEHGLGTHANSCLVITSPEPIAQFSAWAGVDNNPRSGGAVVFTVKTEGREWFRSRALRSGVAPVRIALDLNAPGTAPVRSLILEAGDAGDGISCDHADWAEATLTLQSGVTLRLADLPEAPLPRPGPRYPFSFTFQGRPSDQLLPTWRFESRDGGAPGQCTRTWTDPATGLRVIWQNRTHPDFADCEWLLSFENTGPSDTPIIENVQALDYTLASPVHRGCPARLHRSKGAPADATDFEPAVIALNPGDRQTLGGGEGRSSNRDFPFFKLETGGGSWIVAVGWSGQWAAEVSSPDGYHTRIKAGLELTHFKLHPGEKVRGPSILLFYHPGDTRECNALFRQLIHRHYAAKRNGRAQLPTLFCNTCFTRGGGWLNECTASNQISLIRAYGPLGLEALVTDAGWFEGGWPEGAGNWTPRRAAYPEGMGPVAAAARQHGMVYGLWFEPERVVAHTEFHRQHPDWVLTDGTPGQTTLLANFGLRAVQEHFFNIVRGFMELPGFGFYRQDFNLDPLPYWRHTDAADRQGITEMHYIAGLYAYWDRIASTWPDSLREECASGGRRMDLETLQRMPLHQISDYWFDNEVDQARLWSLSQYLPNNLLTVPLTRLDTYSFHSTLASSLIPAWIADAPDFDRATAARLLSRYREIRHLLVGAWYPLLPYSRDPKDWLASQYDRPDLNEGMILAFRRSASPFRTVDLSLCGLEPETWYDLSFEQSGDRFKRQGKSLMTCLSITIAERHQSELVVYRASTP